MGTSLMSVLIKIKKEERLTSPKHNREMLKQKMMKAEDRL
jgi:hypothetical protein